MSITSDNLPVTHPSSSGGRVLQAKFIRPAQMSLFARVACYPPLGEVTCLKRSHQSVSVPEDKIQFTVILSSSTSFPEQDWEVEIWHNILQNEHWTSLPLTRSRSSSKPTVIGNTDDVQNYHHYLYSAELELPPSAGRGTFTVRYRTGPDTDWQWANQTRYIKDGEVVFGEKNRLILSNMNTTLESGTGNSPRDEIGEYIEGLSTQLEVQAKKSETPNTLLWSITGTAPPAVRETSGRAQVSLGTPKSYLRYFSLVRVWSPWLAPRHGEKIFKLTEDAMLCSFLRSDGLNLVLLAVSGVNDILTLFASGKDGDIVAKARNENTEEAQFQILASVAETFEECICSLIYEARKVVRDSSTAVEIPAVSDLPPEPGSPISDDMVMVGDDARTQWLADWYDGLSYCTWNALGQNLTEQKILEALDALKSHGIKVVNLIIDDNWQSLDNEGKEQWHRAWKSFEANKKGFPSGLRHTTSVIRQRHPNIGHIAVWHALMGYWGGISPEGDLAQKYKLKEVDRKDSVAGGKMLAIDPDDINQFYDDFYSFLTSAGIDAVKTDAQFYIDLLVSAKDRKRFISSYQDAWTIASLRYFSTRAISCMSMTPQLIFHSHIPTNKPSILPGEHDIELINQITAPTTRDTTVILRPSVVGRTLDVYHNYNEGNILRIGTYSGWARTGSGILGLFNISPADVSTIVPLNIFPGIDPTTANLSSSFPVHEDTDGYASYIVRSHSTGVISDIMTPTGAHSLVSVTLANKGWEILTAYPLRTFTLEGSRGCSSTSSSMASLLTHVAVLGLIGKMTGIAAVVTSDITVIGSGRLKFDVNLKALGVLGIYHSSLESRDIDKHVMVMISGLAVPRETVWKDRDNVLAVDVLQAWKALKLDAGWSNEVRVQVFIN
ncbi:hypothetical protein ZTR_10202 [Talaromyces verruculosus]|nr:hypothetical protein ZTR_10202 [Talaromyces verruculosus]